MIGSAVNVAVGNWLLKAEAAYFNGLKFYHAPGEDYSRTDVLAGIEYSGFQNATIGLEMVSRRLNGFTDKLSRVPDFANRYEFQTALRIEKKFLNEKK